jgi:glycosyltransferase involved in cell wall biosynthesis
MQRLTQKMSELDTPAEVLRYVGAVPYDQLHTLYANADLKVFASSCENMPIILLEAMSAGLPVACSRRGPMPEMLGDAGVYFDPEDPAEICAAIAQLLRSSQLRARNAAMGFERAQQYSWKRCAAETFGFLAQCAGSYRATARS